ncbi:MAG: hypothetical protein ACRC46_14780 [Thermoguttaceae bacterium]
MATHRSDASTLPSPTSFVLSKPLPTPTGDFSLRCVGFRVCVPVTP